MRRPPKSLMILSLLLIAVSISFPIQAMVIFGISPLKLTQVFNNISLLNLIIVGACLLNIPFLLRGSRWLMASLPLTIALVAWNNYIVAFLGQDFSMATTTIATLGFLLMNAFVFDPQVLQVLRNPKLRWWLQSPRKEVAIPVQMDPVRGIPKLTETFDLSMSGTFLPLTDSEIGMGEHISLRFSLGSIKQIKCQGKVVRVNESKGRYPKGLGIQFTEISSEDRRALNKYIANIELPAPRQMEL